VDSVDDAFQKFKPSIRFETQAGEEATEFVADLEFRSLKDFSPENIQKRMPGQRNDIADLKNAIDLLYRMKDRWSLPSVKRAWSDPKQRKQILEALARLRGELEKVAGASKGGE
jgi:predicted component of type VI protein secretion system